MSVQSFHVRLAAARRLIAAGWSGSRRVEHWQEQIEAAADECRDQLHHAGFVAAVAQPERGWRQVVRDGDPEQRAYLLAALMGCMDARCPHLRKGSPPQPAYVLLPLRRMDCGRCVGVRRRPPPEDSDRCDVCGARGISFFVPFAVAVGPALISGDACPACAGALDIRTAAA